jgi:manganese/zinc/iron transport system permease protein
MIAYNTLIVLLGTSLLGACAGLIGTFAVLRGRALTGDALSHAAYPGLCLAFLLTGHKFLPTMLTGAFITGTLAVLLISWLPRISKTKNDAAIGLVLTTFFGFGIVLSRIIQNSPSRGSKSGLDSFLFGKTAGMLLEDVITMALISGLTVIVINLLYKEFRTLSFDLGFAKAQGWPVNTLDFILMLLLALTVIVGLQAVGIVMMSALIILPGVTAQLWTNRLNLVLVIAAINGAASGFLGTLISSNSSNLPTGPVIILIGTTFFFISVLFAPRKGLLTQWRLEREFITRMQDRMQLLSWGNRLTSTAREHLPRPAQLAIENLKYRGYVEPVSGQLTQTGRDKLKLWEDEQIVWNRLLETQQLNTFSIQNLNLLTLRQNLSAGEFERILEEARAAHTPATTEVLS